MSKASSSIPSRISRARVLLVGLEPWGAVAAADLAAAGLGALHVLDDPGERAPALRAALAASAPRCAVTTGTLSIAADRSLDLDDAGWDLVVTAVPGDDLRVLSAAARFAEAAGIRSIGAHLDGLEAVIGPAVVPGETACWECCRLRRLAMSPHPEVDHALARALLGARPRPRARMVLASMPALLGHALGLLALDLLAGTSRLVGRIAIQNLVSLETETHAVLPMPRCDVCGGAFRGGRAAPGGSGVDLDDARDPAELRRMLEGVVDRRTGIVRQIIVRPSQCALDPEMPVTATAVLSRYTEGSPRCHHADAEPELGAGKGTTTLRAMVSAVGEAVERYAAGRFDRAMLLRAPVADLAGDPDVLTPADLCPYAEHQYAEEGFPYVRLDPVTPIEWARGFWLDTGAPVLVPALPTYFNYPAPPEAYFTEVNSNGLAAGPTLEAAAVGATLELVERDAFMMSWLARRAGRRVVLDASVDAAAREAARQIEEQGVRVALYLLDAGLGIPTVACVGYGDGRRWPGASVSLAAHTSPRTAIVKAVLEQGHLGPFLCRRVEEGRPVPEKPADVRTLEDHALYYVPRERAAALAFLGAGGQVAAADLEEPAEPPRATLLGRLGAAGLRVAVVDVTSPDLAGTPFRVARALGRGFQQIHFGHRQARLGNPRLLAMAPHGINPDPHPLA